MNAENQKINADAEVVKSLAFFHIPLVEMDDAWTEFRENDYKDTESFKYIEGIIGELGRQVGCGYGEDDMFEKMLELGSTKAMFNGHDHTNAFGVRNQNIDIYTSPMTRYKGLACTTQYCVLMESPFFLFGTILQKNMS